MRPRGVPASAPASHVGSSVTIWVSGVRTIPGATQFTRTLGAASIAADWVRAITPALAAEYGPSPIVGRIPVSEATFTTVPPRPAIIRGSTARRQVKVPFRLTPTSRSHSLSV